MSKGTTPKAEEKPKLTRTGKEMVWENVENGIYKHLKSGTYYERPKIEGVHTFRSLKTDRITEARINLKARNDTRAKGEDPQPKDKPKPSSPTVGDCINLYKEAKYPDKQRGERPEVQRKSEEANCEALLPYWKDILVDEITYNTCDIYADARRNKPLKKGEKPFVIPGVEKVKKECSGDRTVDIEINTLRNALLWAARNNVVKLMPMPTGWPTYCSDKNVKHCRAFMPSDAEELHKIARIFFSKRKSEVLGFQMLFDAYLGQRTKEVLAMRTDAAPNCEGWISPDGKSLCVTRAKGQEMVNPFAFVHAGLEALLKVHKEWKAKRYPESPWYFPGKRGKGDAEEKFDEEGNNITRTVEDGCLNKSALIQGLTRYRKDIGRKIIPHGLRAFYVTVRRSHGIPDNQIAYEIGHTSGGKTLSDVYGGAPTHWKTDGPKMEWLPKGEPAWTVLYSRGILKKPQ